MFVVELAILLNKIIDTFDVVTPLEFMDLLIFFSFLRKKKRFTTLLRMGKNEREKNRWKLFVYYYGKEKEPTDPTFVFRPIWVEMEGNLH